MSVVTLTIPVQRPWRGYDDPGLPVGMWVSQGVVTGDASAGQMAITTVFRPEGARVSGRFFNVEQVEAQISPSNSNGVFFFLADMDTVGDTVMVDRQWGGILASNSSVGILRHERLPPLPWFLGAPRRDTGSFSSQFQVGTPNVDLSTWLVTLQGYIWEPRSMMAQGGLRRPIDSLYSR